MKLTGAIEELKAGRPIVIPTDTVYGLATMPDAVDALYELKGRPRDLPIALLVNSTAMAAELAPLTGRALELAQQHWPGALTLVVDCDRGTIGVRWPDHPVPIALVDAVGPLTTTSANLHGEQTPSELSGVLAALGQPSIVSIDGGVCGTRASTVVRVLDGGVEVLRAGAITIQP